MKRYLNLWIALREEVKVELESWMRPAAQLHEAQQGLIAAMNSHPDPLHILNQTKQYIDPDGAQWFAYSCYFEESERIVGLIDWWHNQYPAGTVIGGLWHFEDGRQYGTVFTEDSSVGGNPVYPVDPRLIAFMPDKVITDESGNVVSTEPATELVQVDRVAGQAKRMFS